MKGIKKITPMLMSTMIAAGSVLMTAGMPVMADTNATAPQDNAIQLTKEYYGDVYPSETLTFTSTPDADNPDTTNLTVDDLQVTGTTNTVNVDLPAYTQVGLYHYTIKEDPGKTQGVTYAQTEYDEIHISVLVSYDDNGDLKAESGITADESGEKNDLMVNDYEVGVLEVTKEVKGNLGDKNKDFNVTVTFKAEQGKTVQDTIKYTDDGTEKTIEASAWTNGEATASITLHSGETVSFTNIPRDITYDVKEAEENQDGYTTTYAFSDNTKEIGKTETDTVTITNEKGTEIDTGITMNRLPYILIVAGIAVVAAFAAVRRRIINR